MNTPAFPIRRLLIAVVPSVSILLLAYLLYSYHRHAFSDYQSSRSFRALNQMENQIKSKLDALEEVIINSGDSAEGKEYLESLHLFTRVDDLTADQVEFRPLKPEGKLVAWRANLQDIFGPLARLDLFESVVIARQDGTVLAQKSSTLVRFADLHSSIQERITGDKKAKSAPSPLVNTQPANFASHSDAFPVNIAGESYHVFLYPMNWKNNQWVLAGFSREPEFRFGAFLDSRYLEFLFILCIVLVAGWPVQKLIDLAPDERIRRRDAQLLLTSGVLLVTLFTCLMLDFYYDSVWDRDTDKLLKAVANEIDHHFTEELFGAYQGLTPLAPRDGTDPKSCVVTPQHSMKCENLLTDEKYADFPFESVEWLNQKGEQRIKWTIRSKAGRFGNRSDRNYFKDLMTRTPTGQFSLERVQSRQTGENTTVIGTHFESPRQAEGLAVRVAGLQLFSVGSVVLPPHFGFAIVNEKGTVMYHADERRVLVENFVEECEEHKDIVAAYLKRAAPKGGSQQSNSNYNPFDATYEGKDTRMYVKAVAVTTLLQWPHWVHWSVIVYAEKAISERQQGYVLGEVLTFLLLYMITVGAVIWMLRLSRGVWWSPPTWNEVPVRLVYLFAIQLVIAACFAALILSERTVVAFTGAFVCPVLAIATTCATLTAKVKLPSKVSGPALPKVLAGLGWPQFGAIIALVVVVGILPDFAFWKVAFVHHAEAVIRQGQLEMAESLERRHQRLAELFTNITFVKPEIGNSKEGLKVSEEKRRRLIDFRAGIVKSGPTSYQALDLYLHPFHDSIITFGESMTSETVCAVNETALQSLEHWFREATTALEQQEYKQWCGGTRENRKTILYKPDVHPSLTIASLTPDSESPADGVTIARVGGLLLAFCALMYYAACRLLYLDRKFMPAPFDVSAQKPLPDKLLLVGPPGFGKSQQLEKKKDEFYIIDAAGHTLETLRALGAQGTWSDSHLTVAIDHLEFGIDDRDWNSAKLQLLERLVYRSQKNVILVSNIDLVLYIRYGNTRFSRFGTDALFPREQRERWVDVLACFQQRDFAEVEDFKIRETASTGHGYQALWRTCSEQERAVLLNLAQDGLVNPKNSGLLVELRRRGILTRNPILGFRDPGFGNFIQRVYGPDQLFSWDMAVRSSSSSSRASLLLGLLVFVGIGLSFTGYETIGPMVASISGLLNLFGTFKGQFFAQSSRPGSSAGTEKG